jgi:hypothetical protein
MCIVAGIVRLAEFAHHIVPHRGDVNSSPTLARHNLDQASPPSFSTTRMSVLRAGPKKKARGNAHVVSFAGEGPLVKINKGRHIVGLKPDSLRMNYGSR